MKSNGWTKRRLGSVAELQRGFDLPNSQRTDGTVPIVSSGGITGYHSEAKSKAPGVVTGRYGSIGDVFYLEEDYWPLNTSLWVKNFHGNHEKYIYYLLCNFDFKKFSDKTGVPGVNRNDLHAVKVSVPPLPEQKKIAQILSTWDKAITTTEQLLANSQQQKKALMQQLLTGKKRLLDKNGVRFSGEWKSYKFGSLFKERVETCREELPLLSITADEGVVYQEDTGRKNTSNEDKSKYRRICVNDIGYNTMRMWQGRSSLSDKEGIVSPAYTIVTPSEKIVPAFAAFLFKLPALIHVFYRHSQGLVSDTWNLKFNHFKKITWVIPGVEEQQAIASVLSISEQKITILQNKLNMLKQEKKALMQQLLTGKRRVVVDEDNMKVANASGH